MEGNTEVFKGVGVRKVTTTQRCSKQSGRGGDGDDETFERATEG